MRTFILKINHPLEDFELNNLTQNRIDMVARIISTVFWIDHEIREDAQLYLCFNNNKVLHYKPPFRNMNIDERNVASFIKHTLAGRKFPGIRLLEQGFQDILSQFKEEDKIFLDASGEKITEMKLPENPVFIIGDDKGYGDYSLPESVKKANIGSKSYIASHCIAFLNIYLDG